MRLIKKILSVVLFSFIFGAAFGQADPPSGYPITNSKGWIKYGWLQNDSGRIDASRDTNWTPRFIPTTVFWVNPGIDSAFWTYKRTTGKRWYKEASGSTATKDTIGVTDIFYVQNTEGAKDTLRSKVLLMSNVTQFATLNNDSALTVFVKDTIRGGTFNKYTGTDAADNGMIFSDGLGNKWLRQTSDSKINILWYGAQSAPFYYSAGYSIRPYFISAQNYARTHSQFNTIWLAPDNRIPYGGPNVGHLFRCDSTLAVDTTITILGDRTQPIYFDSSRVGFTTQFDDKVYFRDLAIYGADLTGFSIQTRDSSAHGIKPLGYTEITNCLIQFFEGDGIHYETCTYPGSPIYGNVDFSICQNNEINYNNNGIYLNGCDANIVKIDHNFLVVNRRWGIYNNGFLGSHASNDHYSINAYTPRIDSNRVSVNYGGVSYYAINTDYYVNINKNPHDSTTYWESWGSDLGYPAWSSTKQYWSGGAYFGSNDNSYNLWENEYTEGNQPPARVSQKDIVLAGDNGAGVKTGIQLEAAGFNFIIRNGGVVVPFSNKTESQLNLNTYPDNATVSVHDKTPNYPTMKLTNDSSGYSNIQFKDTSSANVGEISHSAGDSLFYLYPETNTAKGGILLGKYAANKWGIAPYADNDLELGFYTKAFKNVASYSFSDYLTYGYGSTNKWAFNDAGASYSYLNVKSDNTSTAAASFYGGGLGDNVYSGLTWWGFSADKGGMYYSGANGTFNALNTYNNSAAEFNVIMKYGFGGQNTPLTIYGNGNFRLRTLPTGAAKYRIMADASGYLYQYDSAQISHGTYTPTLTGVANVAASTAYLCQYSRVWNVVTVSGEVDIDPTTTLTLTQLGVSLPIASAIANSREVAGTAADDLGTAVRAAGDATNDRCELRFTPTDVTNRRFSFTFTYRLL